MNVDVQVTIDGSKEAVWAKIADIANAASWISGIDKTEVLEEPTDGLVGFKWRETRVMFGKSVTEVMWITDAVENESYKARAESHGCVYRSSLSIVEQDGRSVLTMAHNSEARTFLAKVLSVPMTLFCSGMMRKAIRKDLEDIKSAVEQGGGEG